jgi:hypothetical protein
VRGRLAGELAVQTHEGLEHREGDPRPGPYLREAEGGVERESLRPQQLHLQLGASVERRRAEEVGHRDAEGPGQGLEHRQPGLTPAGLEHGERGRRPSDAVREVLQRPAPGFAQLPDPTTDDERIDPGELSHERHGT